MSITSTEIAAQVSLTAALRQVLNQVLRLLESNEPATAQADGGPLLMALENWRKTIVTQTSDLSVKRARRLENEALELRGKLATIQKECTDLRERNGSLRDELVRINKREEKLKQEMLEAKLLTKRHKTEARELDMEVRDLRRRLQELEGGPPLSPSEAAPRSTVEVVESSGTEPQSPEIEIQVQVPHSTARSAVEDAFRAMWKPPAEVKSSSEVRPSASITSSHTKAKKAPAKKAAKTKTKKAAAKKTTAKKTPAKKAPAKKAPAKKAAKTKKAAAKKATPKNRSKKVDKTTRAGKKKTKAKQSKVRAKKV